MSTAGEDRTHRPQTRSRVPTVTGRYMFIPDAQSIVMLTNKRAAPKRGSSRQENATPGPSNASHPTRSLPHPVEVISISDDGDGESETSDYESELEALQVSGPTLRPAFLSLSLTMMLASRTMLRRWRRNARSRYVDVLRAVVDMTDTTSINEIVCRPSSPS